MTCVETLQSVTLCQNKKTVHKHSRSQREPFDDDDDVVLACWLMQRAVMAAAEEEDKKIEAVYTQ
jgi:lysophospholipid acyltransferase (LPLAT)-like uncharacterized protein